MCNHRYLTWNNVPEADLTYKLHIYTQMQTAAANNPAWNSASNYVAGINIPNYKGHSKP